jgi:uncharacterized protein (UPF0297 family)
MARKKNEFRPDAFRQDILGKLLLTRKQATRLLRWVLFSAVCLAGLLVQDVVMSRFTIFGTTTDLVPCCILAVCILQGAESGCMFALIGSMIYCFSGSAPGIFAIPLITVIAVLTAIFRQAYLRKHLLAHHQALQAKGYDPITQLVGYIISGDPTYITSYNSARSLICRLERDEILEELVRSYMDTH